MSAKYEILYDQTFPIVKFNLNMGEKLKAEADAMIAMSATVEVTGGIEGGLLSGLARKFLTGEKFFFQYLTAKRGPGEVLLSQRSLGGIIDVDLDGSYELIVQKDGFLASTDGIEISTTMQNLMTGLFSKEGFFVLKVGGKGVVFLSSYGSIHTINLKENEEIVIDNGHLVAWPNYMQYKIEKAASGWINSLTSGECLVCRFTGPGPILIQSHKTPAIKGSDG
jgi:uncharacterized protein (TIGR00266 family)